MSYTFFMNDSQVTLINLSNGNRVTVHNDDERFPEFSSLVSAGQYEKAECLDVKTVVSTFTAPAASDDFSVNIVNGVGTVKIGVHAYALNQVIVDKIVKMKEQGFSVEPLVAFLKNLYNNPSKVAINELFLFLEAAELPITPDGCFIAYKVIRNDYLDIHSGTMDNSVGKVCSMPRFAVDDNRNNTCSAGLHFCSKEYLSKFGSSRMDNDRCVLLKINPADVVSIPSDYGNTKGRACRYEVVGEVTADNWRDNLSKQDYTDKTVDVSFTDSSSDDEDTSCTTLSDGKLSLYGFRFDSSVNRWRDSYGKMVSRAVLAAKFGVSVADIIALE